MPLSCCHADMPTAGDDVMPVVIMVAVKDAVADDDAIAAVAAVVTDDAVAHGVAVMPGAGPAVMPAALDGIC